MAFSISYFLQYSKESTKLARKSEAAVEANRVLNFLFDEELGIIKAAVQASMRDKSYNVEVS